MADALRELLPAVAILYLLDGVRRVVPAGVAYRRLGLGDRFRRLTEGLRWAGPFPWSRCYLAWSPGVGLAEAGLYLPRAPAARLWRRESFLLVPWDRGDAVELHGRSLSLGGRRAELPSAAHGGAVRRLLADLGPLPPERRRARIAALRRRRLDADRVRHRIEHLERAAAGIQGLALGAAAALLGAWAATAVPLSATAWASAGLLAACLVLTVAVAVLTARACRRLRGHGLPDARGLALPLLMIPPAALRAPAGLGEGLLADFDDAAVAVALLAPGEARRRIAAELHALRHAEEPAGAPTEAAAEPGWEELVASRRRGILALAARVGWDGEAADIAPARIDPTAAAHCPACSGDFVSTVRPCPECGLPLVPLRA